VGSCFCTGRMDRATAQGVAFPACQRFDEPLDVNLERTIRPVSAERCRVETRSNRVRIAAQRMEGWLGHWKAPRFTPWVLATPTGWRKLLMSVFSLAVAPQPPRGMVPRGVVSRVFREARFPVLSMNDPSTTSFAARLRMLRSQRPDITQDRLADEVGVSQNAIGKWERGESVPRIDALRKLCEVYGVSADYLVGLAATPSPVPPDWWIVDLEHVEAIRKAKTEKDVEALEHPDGSVPTGFPIPTKPGVLSSSDYASLRSELEVLITKARRKK